MVVLQSHTIIFISKANLISLMNQILRREIMGGYHPAIHTPRVITIHFIFIVRIERLLTSGNIVERQ